MELVLLGLKRGCVCRQKRKLPEGCGSIGTREDAVGENVVQLDPGRKLLEK
jgi:hypothetical protein